MENIKVAAVVPTFNRKELLVECLQSVCSQTYKPYVVYVCDNKSTDGTRDFLRSNGFYDSIVNGVIVKYVEMPINGGGAMGFSIGMEMAFKDSLVDAFWMMDDDGLPKSDCLEHLIEFLHKHDYVSPIVYSRINKNELVAPIDGDVSPSQIQNKYGKGKMIFGYCNPFNGGLFSRKLVKIVGFPKKELFIYGDEMNYHQRCLMCGFVPVAVPSAIHFHPPFDVNGTQKFGVVNFKPTKVAMYCQWRNNIYNKKIRFKQTPIVSVAKIINYYLVHNYFFLFKKLSIKWLLIFHKAFFAGLFNIWGGQYKYLR